jgi:DNA-binding protein HU-beta
VNKEQAIAKIAEIRNTTKVEAEKNLESVLKLMEYCIENKDPLKLVGYFSMEVVERAQKNGISPQTKEPMIIPAKNAVRVKIGNKLKELAK